MGDGEEEEEDCSKMRYWQEVRRVRVSIRVIWVVMGIFWGADL